MDRRVEAALAKLAGDPKAAHAPENLAALVNLSPRQLRRLFKQEVGRPLGAFARTSRMELARSLLDTTFLSVKEIAYNLGLMDETHFIREFKKAFGVTPNVYRQGIASNRAGGGADADGQKSR